jgi:hypothetical protein
MRLARAHIVVAAVVAVVVVVAGCDHREHRSSNAAIVHIESATDGYKISVDRDGRTLGSWSTTSLDGHVGERVDGLLGTTPSLGVVFCGDSHVTVHQLHDAARGVPRGRELVTCMPDRSNCPDSC